MYPFDAKSMLTVANAIGQSRIRQAEAYRARRAVQRRNVHRTADAITAAVTVQGRSRAVYELAAVAGLVPQHRAVQR